MDRKSIFITGAASGFGEAVAKLFASKGWFIGLTDINEEGLSKVAGVIGEDNCCQVSCDVTDEESVRQAIHLFGEHTGGQMDVLFANAGIADGGDFDSKPLADWKKVFRVNAEGVVNTIYYGIPLVKKSKGTIISSSSASAFFGVPNIMMYAACKRFVRGLTEGLGFEMEKHGVHVTDIMPYFARTNMVISNFDQIEGLQSIEEVTLTAEEVAQVVWKAVTTRKKIHWPVGGKAKQLAILTKILPTSWIRKLIKALPVKAAAE